MELQGYFEFGKTMLEIRVGPEKRKISVLVDTGFNGELMLSTNILKDLKLNSIGLTDYLTANGKRSPAFVYIGNIEWFGEDRKVTILSNDAGYCLLGMELLHYFRLVVERHKNILRVSK